MKKLLFISFLFVSILAFAQGEAPHYSGMLEEYKVNRIIEFLCEENPDGCNPDACRLGIATAATDIKNSKPKFYYFEPPSTDFTSYLWVLETQYHIHPVFANKISKIEAQCYNKAVNQIMVSQYGARYWGEIAIQADSITSLGMSEEEMWNFIYCNLTYPENKESLIPKVVVHCAINGIGELEESRIETSFSPRYDQEALRVVRAIPKWKPVEQTLSIPIVFDKDMRVNCE